MLNYKKYDLELFLFQRNERREREQRELAKLAAKESGCGSDERLSKIYGSQSITDSDTYTQVRRTSRYKYVV